MNVLHINQSDIGGGAAIAGYRLHQSLLQQGVNSKLLVGKVKTDSSLVAAVGHNYRVENQLLRLTRRLGLNYLHLVSTFDIWKHDFYEQADIINFHNLHTGYFNYLGIPGLTKSKPAIFTLHDMWSFTGHCAYSYDCDRWQQGCGQCPYPETYPEIARDNTRLEWQLKDWVYSKSNLTIVTPSQWLTEQAKKSILNRFSIYHIPYGLNTDAYQPLDKDKCKNILGIPAEKKVIMFCADGLEDSRKGGDLLVQAIQTLPKALKAETLLLTLGSGGEKVLEVVGIPTLNLGYVSGDRMKSIAYSAADVFIFPTRADNLPLVLQESMACGTPMVSFKIGGVPDLVRPGITGYLAQPEDTQDFCNGIVQLLLDREQRHKMSENCRAIALQEYTLELQAKRYIELYQQVLQSP
ncbi:glycosyltransferase family 4 protein [Nostoc sp. UCD121]|uniref:glycosyltransferase family 4 protein n=1 Tax=unclassified Nostoc TaxID=2593658 RepID=UPI001629BE82|nr:MULTISPECIES: glycosyltransferase family 4 protein [unclassified Nostoc]MBC1225150.1 glycosyltransferase family 4 protein [Nostoc sp. UCD120]MBC1278932.1 glycosyltransferase family 4 protein [Nostoc sp. UCD121]MBC1295094.1 glycosyltransferase family 4 protein [Nostoc sp. UCD122]